MANAEEFCRFARLGQTAKIQKSLQTHCVDINALNLYGESALSIATYYNQILCVEYLLANKADPKLRLSAGHTAIHIACRSANLPILHLLLSLKKEEDEKEFQEKEDRHIYDCLRINDHADLTPVHWAATQESVSKRQKVFAYLDQRMPGVLDSRYNSNWFHSWAKTHPWVTEQRSIRNSLAISPVHKLTNTDHIRRQYYEQGTSLPFVNVTAQDLTSRTSLNGYERTPILPLTPTTNASYDNIHKKGKRTPLKVEFPSPSPPPVILPPTPITSRIVTTKHPPIQQESREPPYTQKQLSFEDDYLSTTLQKTPYSQRLSAIVKRSFSPPSPQSTYRAERAHVIPTFHFPLSPTHITSKSSKEQACDDMVTPISSKRPSHNLLSNIVPSSSTSSSDQSSRHSRKPFASFGFDTSIDLRSHRSTTNLKTYTQHDNESFYDDDNPDYQSNQFDYLCDSASTLAISSPRADTYDP